MPKITPSEIRQKLTGKTIWLWHYLHADWQWEHSRHWHEERYALAVREALDLMREDPEFCYFFDTASEFFSAVEPRLGPRLEELKERVWEGRVRLVSGQVANCRPTQVGDETFIRNLQLGRKYFETHLPPTELTLFHSVDIAIGGVQMPQILTQAGFKYYRAWRPHGPLNALGIPHQFIWQGLDGSRILVTRGSYSGWFGDSPANLEDSSWDEIVAWAYASFFHDQLLQGRSSSDHLWMIHGADDARPLRNFQADQPDQVQRFIRLWRERESVPIHWCTPLEFSQAVASQAEHLPVVQGVLDGVDVGYNIANHGSQGLWVWRQMNDRRLLRAEAWAAVASSIGFSYPGKELQDLWYQHCTYQAHAQDHGFKEDWGLLVERARQVKYHAEHIQEQALRAIVQAAGGGGRTTRYLFNPLPWPVETEVEMYHACPAAGVNWLQVIDKHGKPFAQQSLSEFRHPRYGGSLTDARQLVRLQLPPMGYRRVEIVESALEPSEAFQAHSAPKDGVIEAAGLRLIYHQDSLVEVNDLASGQVYRSSDGAPWPGLFFHVLDHQDWLFAGPELRRERYQPESSSWLHYGPLRWTHRSKGLLGPYAAVIDTSLGSRERELRVDVRLEGHWATPPLTGFVSLLAEVGQEGELTVDTPFAIERRDPEQDIYEGYIPTEQDLGIMDMFERLRPGVFWGRSWCDWSKDKQGLTLISLDGCTYWYKDPRSFGHLLSRCVELKPGTWEAFCPLSLTGAGVHDFSYILRFHDGDWREGDPQRRSLELRHPPVIVRPDCPTEARLSSDYHSFLSLQGSALLSAFYHQGNAGVVRFYEHTGKGGQVKLTFDRPLQAAQAEDLLGRPVDVNVILQENTLIMPLKPWQIVTLSLTSRSS